MKMKAIALKQYAEEKFKLSHYTSRQRDGRGEEVEVKTGVIFEGIAYQPTLGIRSMLGMDHWMRTAEAHTVLGRGGKTGLAMSDTLMLEAAGTWEMEGLREANRNVYQVLRRDGGLTVSLSSGKEARLGVVDGSWMGGHWMSAFVCLGEGLTVGIDIEGYRTRGNELAASRTILTRTAALLGKGFVSHVLADALYGNREDFKLGMELEYHLVVKMEEEGENTMGPIVWAKELFSGVKRASDAKELGVECAEGTDAVRNIRYEVMIVKGVEWNVKKGEVICLTVAYVVEEHLKGKYAGQTFKYWVVTTDQSLTAVEMRDLGHTRWRIENNLFKELNELVGSKRAYIKDEKAKQALMLMWFFGWSLWQSYLLAMKKVIDRLSEGVKRTKSWYRRLFSIGKLRIAIDTA